MYIYKQIRVNQRLETNNFANNNMDSDFTARHDEMLMEILRDEKIITGFLDAIFGFLARRTDFYCEMKAPTDRIGFPAGVKEKIVFTAMEKFDPKYVLNAPAAVNEVEIETTATAIQNTYVKDQEETKSAVALADNHVKRDAIKKEKQALFQSNEYYNGAKFDNYCWSQTITDVEIHIHLPEHIQSSKKLDVQITTDFIKIQERHSDNVILEGKMHSKCKSNDAVWSISSGKLQITLDKSLEIWWNRFLESEPILDLSKMDCSRNIEELSEETQAALEKIRWDEQQKILGRPTSDEIKNTELLRKAWNAEGSPFKGQPFDSSVVKFQ